MSPSVSVDILGSSRVGSHTEYTIRVRSKDSESTVSHRYTDFEQLDAKVRPQMDGLPNMPPKGELRKLSKSFLYARENDLAQLLKKMVAKDPMLLNPDLREFVGLPPLTQATLLQQLRPDWLPRCRTADLQKREETRPECLDSETIMEALLAFNLNLEVSDSDGEKVRTHAEDNASRPDFSGLWVLSRCEGDMDALLKELSLPWVVRKAASAAGYGVGKARSQINQTADEVEVENINPIKNMTRVFKTDRAFHEESLDGRTLSTTSRWEGSVLVSESAGVKPVRSYPKVMRYLLGEEMVVEQVMSDGLSVKQIFQRKTVASEAPSALVPEVVTVANPQDGGSEAEGEDHPDFSGAYVLSRYEGDVEAMMKELAFPWMLRKAANASGHGVGTLKVHVKQTTDSLQLDSIHPLKSMTRIFKLDGNWAEAVVDGNKVKCASRWNGATLVTQTQGIKPAMPYPDMHRYMQGGEMVVEQVLSDGKTVKHFFTVKA